MENNAKKYIINKITSGVLDNSPFPHVVIDDFFPSYVAESLSAEYQPIAL